LEQQVTAALGPALGGYRVVDADARLTLPGGQMAHVAQHEGSQLTVLSLVRRRTRLLIEITSAVEIAEVERQPTGKA
jgi:hypothetical protein